MARRKQSRGTCTFCGREMTRSGLGKHLANCPKRQEAIAAASSGTEQTIYHLLVYDAYTSDYWLHLEVNGRASLKELDSYLRSIWLECCGHLSRFSFGGWQGQEIPMSHKIENVFTTNAELTHIYDFGTSSKTMIKVVTKREGSPLTRHPIFLMARNNMPEAKCAECEKKAGWYCVDCWTEKGLWVTVCDKHVANHSHGGYSDVAPLVNSPRLGMCGYDGSAEPPY